MVLIKILFFKNAIFSSSYTFYCHFFRILPLFELSIIFGWNKYRDYKLRQYVILIQLSIIVILLGQRQLIHHAAVTVRDLMINQCKHLPVGQSWFLVYYREFINATNQFDRVVQALSRISPTYSLHFNILVYAQPTIRLRSIISLKSYTKNEYAISLL